MSLPLDGIKVLDLGRIFAGPFATQLLADFGAEVIKIERPDGRGDELRAYGPPFLRDADGNDTAESAFYLSANRNKKAMAIDIASSEGQELVRKLAAQSDVLVQNFKVGDLERYGLDYESIRGIKPDIIYCSITGFGQTGPYARMHGQDLMFQAMSGLMSLTGDAEGPPYRVGMAFSDIISAMSAANAILAALYHRDARGGQGQHIDIGILDATIAALSHRAMVYLVSGEPPGRLGNMTAASFPAQNFICADGQLMLQASQDAHFKRFCKAIGRPELAEDPRFATRAPRFQNRREALTVIEPIMAGKTVAEWIGIFNAAQVMCAPINDLRQAFDDPQVRHRGMRVEVPHDDAGVAPLVRNAAVMSGTPLDRYIAPPRYGQHTREVLAAMLSLTPAQIDELFSAGVVA